MHMNVKRILKRVVPTKLRYKLREQAVAMSVKHLHGPKSVGLLKNEASVTCVVRNGEYYIESFIRHYSRMGFKHIFFLDNGSSDRTVAIARKYDNVSVCQSTLSVQDNQRVFKKYLAQNSVEGGWCLDVDIDEFFDYPYSDVVSLNDFIEYLNRNNFSTVITQMLDMFSEKPLSDLTNEQEEDLRAVYQYFDISDVRRTAYGESELTSQYGARNTVSSSKTELYWGGIRKGLYGIDVLLSKHSLFLPEKKLDLFPHVHFVNNGRLADMSCVILHYKLTGNALASALQNKQHFWVNRKHYEELIKYITDESAPQIKQSTAVKLERVNELVENGFLFVSAAYREYASSLTQERIASLQGA